jgi:AbiU2
VIRKRKRVTISQGEALRRLKAMIRALERDVKIGLWAEAVMTTGNDIFPIGTQVAGGRAYIPIMQALVGNLAITLARLFDSGAKRFHPNKRDLASIPLLVRLLDQRRCRRVLIREARQWTPSLSESASMNAARCETSINEAVKIYQQTMKKHGPKSGVKRLRNFRNFRLAHTMYEDPIKAWPNYLDLFVLLDAALQIVDHAKLAIDGVHIDLKNSQSVYREISNHFWRAAFRSG